MQLTRQKNHNLQGNIVKTSQVKINNFIKNLPFTLTPSQNKVLQEIFTDQASNKKMTRLIQGDVGCGKTIIAIIAMLNNIFAGYQTVLMAPTAILAKQHYTLLKEYLKEYDIEISLLIGEIKGKRRQEILSNIKTKQNQIIIGTHALFYDQVKFNNLGLVVIDEQHRFGVKQRLNLTNKGDRCDLLLMSATPIPRSLAMTIYGDMDVSIIDQKPYNRKKIDTRIISMQKLPEIIKAIHRALEQNEKIYWICPLIEESKNLNLSAAQQRYNQLSKIFGKNIVALIHGKMSQEQKDKTLHDFLHNKYKILIATTVIEVGINIKDATIMIIENANKFGLAQLHQLRGRVGRGEKNGTCLLLYNKVENTNNYLDRLKVIRKESDGFKIAEEDLKMRGAGEIMGTKQSGMHNFRIANIKEDYNLLKIASKDAQLLLNKDPHLKSDRGQAAQKLLQIFSPLHAAYLG